MKAVTALPALLLAGCAAQAPSRDSGSLDWLAGCWRLDRGGATYEEMWLPPNADGTIGIAREVRHGRTVSHEFERIVVRPEGLVFIAQPYGQAPTEFRVVENALGRLAFENPAHDFPTRIEYRYVDLNAVTARISGTIDGQARSLDYPMQRMECEG